MSPRLLGEGPLDESVLANYKDQKLRNIGNSKKGVVLLIVMTAIATTIIFLTNPHSRFILLAITVGADLIPGYLLYRYRHKDDVTLESTLLLKDFYLNNGQNIDGRTLAEILEYPDEEFDNHIQWILPTTDRSQHGSKAPIMTEEVAKALRKHGVGLHVKALNVIKKILSLYSLQLDLQENGSWKVIKANDWIVDKQPPAWLTSPTDVTMNQFNLRMTRLIIFLKLISKEHLAWSLVNFFKDIIEGKNGLMYQNLTTMIDRIWEPTLKGTKSLFRTR